MKRILIVTCALALLLAGCAPALAAEASESQGPDKSCYYPIAVESYTSGPLDELRISKTYQENICQGGFHPKDEIPYKLEFIKSAALQRPYSNPCHA